MTSDINNPLISHCLLLAMAPKGMEPGPTRNNGERAKNSKGAHSRLSRQRQNTKGNDPTDQGKTKTHMNTKINHATQKTQTHGPTGLCELFLLTVPIEEVARCQYKTVQIIFPLNLQTITITLDAVKWLHPRNSFIDPGGMEG